MASPWCRSHSTWSLRRGRVGEAHAHLVTAPPPPRPLLLPSPGELAGCYTTQGPRFAPLHFSASPRRRASPKASPTARSTLKTFCPVCLSARKLRALQRRSGRCWTQTRGQRPSCCCCGFAFSSPSLPVSLSSSCRSLQI